MQLVFNKINERVPSWAEQKAKWSVSNCEADEALWKMKLSPLRG